HNYTLAFSIAGPNQARVVVPRYRHLITGEIEDGPRFPLRWWRIGAASKVLRPERKGHGGSVGLKSVRSSLVERIPASRWVKGGNLVRRVGPTHRKPGWAPYDRDGFRDVFQVAKA